MKDIDYGKINIKLSKIMEEQNISINRLANRAELQRTQLKHYMKNDIQRLDISILTRLCYVLECNLEDLIEYIPPNDDSN